MTTILRPMLVSEALGRAGFGEINGMLSIPSLAASALAPVLGAALLQGQGPGGVIGAALVFALMALILAWRMTRGAG